jgi:hypothetical protein
MEHKIVFGEGTDYERELYVHPPKGKKARMMMPKILSFMSMIAEKQRSSGKEEEGLDFEQINSMLTAFWSTSEFEDVLVPFVLGLDDPEGRKYLEENGTTMDIVSSFMVAAQHLIEESFGRKEVQAALGKSNEEAPEAQ